ncbi:MAG: hypothetical protein ABIP67_15295 [Burkholderiales bacterium]
MSASPARHEVEYELTRVVTPPKPAAAVKVLTPAPIEAVMHPHVYRIALGCWVVFMAIFWVTFWVSANALFMVVIGTFYAVMFFGVPYMMLRMVPGRTNAKGPFFVFLEKPFAIIDGTMHGYEALLQVVMVPACLILGGTAIAFIIRSARALH